MFKTMTGVLDAKSTPNEEEIKKIPSYVFCRWLAGSRYTILASNTINRYHRELDIVTQYKLIKSAFGGKIKYIKYPKNSDGFDYDQKTVDILTKHFKISQTKAIEYMSIIDKKELETLIEMYRTNDR